MLDERQRQAARLCGEGKLVKDAAAAVGVVPGTVGVWRRLPEFVELMEEWNDPARRTLLLALDSDNEETRVRAARALGRPVERAPKEEQTVTHVTIRRQRGVVTMLGADGEVIGSFLEAELAARRGD